MELSMNLIMNQKKMKTTNNTHQVNGSHYEGIGKIEPVHLMVEYNLNWFQGEILKYVSRHWTKNGITDLMKAIHIADMSIDLKPIYQSKERLHHIKTYIAYSEQFRDRLEGHNRFGPVEFTALVQFIIAGNMKLVKSLINIMKYEFYEKTYIIG